MCGRADQLSQRAAATSLDELLTGVKDIAHGVHAAFVVATQTFQPAYPTTDVPSLTIPQTSRASIVLALRPNDQLADHGLHETGRLLSRAFGYTQEALNECGLCCDPAQATSWGNGLAECIEADYTALVVDRQVRRHKRVKEVEAGRLYSNMLELTSIGGRRGELKVPVWVIFHNDDVVLDRQFVDLLASFNAEYTTGWVLANPMFG